MVLIKSLSDSMIFQVFDFYRYLYNCFRAKCSDSWVCLQNGPPLGKEKRRRQESCEEELQH